jgi:alpha-aminoadipate carrier protein LysW
LDESWSLNSASYPASGVKIDFSGPALDTAARATKYYQCGLIETEAIMVLCPECENNLDVDEEEVDEGEVVSCSECGTDFEVVTVSPLELKAMEEAKYEEDDEEEEAEDGDYS